MPARAAPCRARIRVLAPSKEYGITYQVPAKLRMDQVDGDGYYTPKPLNPHSKFGQYLDLFQPDLEVRALLQEAVASSLAVTRAARIGLPGARCAWTRPMFQT